MPRGLRCAAGHRRSGPRCCAHASAITAGWCRFSRTVGCESHGNRLNSRQLLNHLLRGLAKRLELGGAGWIDGNGEIDLAATNDDLGYEPERDDIAAEIRALDVPQRVEHPLLEDGLCHAVYVFSLARNTNSLVRQPPTEATLWHPAAILVQLVRRAGG